MDKIIAVCGLVCNECRAFIATQEDDDGKREEVVEAWSTERESLTTADLDCDGCQTGKRLFRFCLVCGPRLCALGKGFENCSSCAGYPCGKLEGLWGGFRTVSKEDAKANLDRMKESLRDR